MGRAWVGASVPGSRHIAQQEVNQDAWCAWVSPMLGAAVSDGIGSKRLARESAKAACRAAWQAAAADAFTSSDCCAAISYIEDTWASQLQDQPQSDIGATCLIGVQTGPKQVLLLQVGDGGVYFRARGLMHQLPQVETGWLNETASIRSGARWSTATVDDCDLVVLASDGVANDLATERLDNLAAALDRLADSHGPDAQGVLRSDLKYWPTRHRQDDRTLVALWPSEARHG